MGRLQGWPDLLTELRFGCAPAGDNARPVRSANGCGLDADTAPPLAALAGLYASLVPWRLFGRPGALSPYEGLAECLRVWAESVCGGR